MPCILWHFSPHQRPVLILNVYFAPLFSPVRNTNRLFSVRLHSPILHKCAFRLFMLIKYVEITQNIDQILLRVAFSLSKRWPCRLYDALPELNWASPKQYKPAITSCWPLSSMQNHLSWSSCLSVLCSITYHFDCGIVSQPAFCNGDSKVESSIASGNYPI